jgi:hypothetical protein
MAGDRKLWEDSMQKALLHSYFPMTLEKLVPHNIFKWYMRIHISCMGDVQMDKLGSMMSIVIYIFISLQFPHYPSQLGNLTISYPLSTISTSFSFPE